MSKARVQPEPLWRVADVAARYGRRPDTVLAWIRRGDLLAIRVQRTLFIRECDLLEFEQSRVTVPE